MLGDEAFSCFTGQEELWLKGNSAKQLDTHVRAHLSSTTGDWRKNLTLTSAVRAHEATHVFNDSKHGCLSLLAEVDLLPHVTECDLLGCSHDDGSCNSSQFKILNDGDVLI